MKVIYIAGPFRAPTAWQIEKNVRAAEEVAHWVWMQGHVALCPHTNTRFFNGEGTDQLWIDGTLELMWRCDGMLLVPDWQHSVGTNGEVRQATQRKMPYFEYATEHHEFLRWVNTPKGDS